MDAIKVLAAADSGRVYMDKSAQLKKDVDSLTLAIQLYNSIIYELNQQDSIQQRVIEAYQAQIAIMTDQRKLLEKQIKHNDKTIRKLKRKAFWTSAAGLAGMGAMTYLLLTK